MALKPNVDEKQFKCMVEAIYFEAGNQSYQGKIGVANVIQERVRTDKKGRGVCEVIRKPKQFSYFQMSAYKRQNIQINNPKVRVAMMNAVTIALAAMREKLPNIVKGAQFYLNPGKATDFSWSRKFYRTVIVGDHHFYRSTPA